MIYDFLYKPRRILTQLRNERARLDGLRLSMLPSGIRYDTDKVQSSPTDPMPEYAAKVEELLVNIHRLEREYWDSLDDITKAALHLEDDEQNVIMLRYVSQKRWNEIAMELHYTERWMFTVHSRAVRRLEKKFPNL